MAASLVGRFLGAGLLAAAEVSEARIALGLTVTGLKIAAALRMAESIGEDEGGEIPQQQEVAWMHVHSTAINAIGWRRDNVILVEFKRGGIYTYDGTYELFQAFVAAPSKGQFFNTFFK